MKEYSIENESEFFRNIFFKYLDNPRYIREQILFFGIFEKIEIAIKKRRYLEITKHNKNNKSLFYEILVRRGDFRTV